MPAKVDPVLVRGPTTTNILAGLNTGTDDWTVPDNVKKHPYFVELGGDTSTMMSALEEIDRRMRANHDHHLITCKKPHTIFGDKQVQAGFVGLFKYKGRPIVATQPGLYWNWSLSHHWLGTKDVTEPIDVAGLTMAQVGQSSALVVEDPENRIFVIKNGGFAVYAPNGRFRVLAVVDTLDLGKTCAITESDGRVLGWLKDIHHNNVRVATFLNVPANNIAVVQKGNTMLALPAGQHVLLNMGTTFRQFYTLGERQAMIKTQPAYTLEGVPVLLTLNLRYRVVDPILLTASYDSAIQALKNPAQIAVNGVVSRLSYQQFMRARRVGGDVPDIDIVPWLDAFKAECLEDLAAHALTYGVEVLAFDVMDRALEGSLGEDLERQAEQVLRNQIEATQVEIQNRIRTETQRGHLEISRVKADQTKTEADASYYASTRTADAEYYENLKRAEAAAAAAQLQAEQEAKNILVLAEARQKEIEVVSRAYAAVSSEHAKLIQLEELEIEKRKALPQKTIYFGGAESQGGAASMVSGGLAFGLGQGLNTEKH
ncbi:hypothetical protein BC832DRAFT_591291 [Gaertneriomyces semiglobifer]|nr:hypothetical protein BC832DRAFT_591291 [Gaertneriomyces semiglobifer]